MLFPTGKEEEVVNIHPRAMFIPQNGWTFLAAGTIINNVLSFIVHLYFWICWFGLCSQLFFAVLFLTTLKMLWVFSQIYRYSLWIKSSRFDYAFMGTWFKKKFFCRKPNILILYLWLETHIVLKPNAKNKLLYYCLICTKFKLFFCAY